MRWIGAFNVVYGAIGLAAALYLGQTDAIMLCVWVMLSGVLLRSGVLSRVGDVVRRRLGRNFR